MNSDIQYERLARKYRVNHTFFSSLHESEAQFYWAGFIAANSTISTKNGRFTAYRIFTNVAARDADYLEQMRLALGSDAPVRTIQITQGKKKHLVSRLLISSKYMVEDLERWNIVPRKKTTYIMPQWLEHHPLVRHFLRGWIDGLGGVYHGPHGVSLRTTGTMRFLEQFKQILNQNLTLQESDRHIVPTTNEMGRLIFINKEDIAKIIDWLYSDCQVFMNRKREVALNEPRLAD